VVRTNCAFPPCCAGNRLDRLHGDVAFGAQRQQRLDIGAVVGPFEQDEVVGEQHRVEVERAEAAQMHRRDTDAMTGHADEPAEPLVTCSGHRLHDPTHGERLVPLVGFDKIVQLDEVDAVDTHSLQGSLQLGARRSTGTLACLGCQKHPLPIGRQPRRQA
jgi:hypothetical protein